MEPKARQRIRKRGVLLATAGLLLALAVELALKLFGLATISPSQWSFALGLTLLVQALLWLIPHLGWDEHLSWDPHYLYLPMTAAAFLLNLYVYIAPEARVLLLMAWFPALLYMAGLVGIIGVLILSGFMGGGYLAVVGLLIARKQAVDMSFEAVLTGVFLVVCGYAGVVYERLRLGREEGRALKRKLVELAVTDPLTGLPNRRHFEEILRGELDRIERYGGECGLAMIDVDYFKNFNDNLGHMAGDEILKELADLMRKHMRTSDLLARYGGDEFALIMVITSKEEARKAMDRLRLLVGAETFQDADLQPSGCITLSIGVAAAPDDGTQYEALVRQADRALLEAKRHGGNQVKAA